MRLVTAISVLRDDLVFNRQALILACTGSPSAFTFILAVLAVRFFDIFGSSAAPDLRL
jgi:hypothetical protein